MAASADVYRVEGVITHEEDKDGIFRQKVPPEELRRLLMKAHRSLKKPDRLYEDKDEWFVK